MNKLSIVILAVGLAVAGCKKKQEAGTGTGSATASGSGSASASGSGSATASGSASGSATAPDPQATADYLKVVADHKDPDGGKVDVVFASWKVVSASFDPANLEGGTAEIEVDPASLSTGIPKRDKHLKSPDYLDVATFPKATVKISNVKKTGDKAYTADALMSIHGIEKSWPLSFEVTATTADSVTVQFTQPFSREDFKVSRGEEDTSKPEMELQGRLTIKKT